MTHAGWRSAGRRDPRKSKDTAAGFFTCYMEMALYAPGLGYYVAAPRAGARGFVTAPEISRCRTHTRPGRRYPRAQRRRRVEPEWGSGALAHPCWKLQAQPPSERYRILNQPGAGWRQPVALQRLLDSPTGRMDHGLAAELYRWWWRTKCWMRCRFTCLRGARACERGVTWKDRIRLGTQIGPGAL